MIGSECKKRSNNQFNLCSLNVQDKIDCNKINEIREERIANSIYIDSATSRAYVQSSSNPFEIFHYLCKSFTKFEHTLGSFTLVFKILQETTSLLTIILTIQEITSLLITILIIQETTSLLITIEFMRWIKRFLSFRVHDTNWIS